MLIPKSNHETHRKLHGFQRDAIRRLCLLNRNKLLSSHSDESLEIRTHHKVRKRGQLHVPNVDGLKALSNAHFRESAANKNRLIQKALTVSNWQSSLTVCGLSLNVFNSDYLSLARRILCFGRHRNAYLLLSSFKSMDLSLQLSNSSLFLSQGSLHFLVNEQVRLYITINYNLLLSWNAVAVDYGSIVWLLRTIMSQPPLTHIWMFSLSKMFCNSRLQHIQDVTPIWCLMFVPNKAVNQSITGFVDTIESFLQFRRINKICHYNVESFHVPIWGVWFENLNVLVSMTDGAEDVSSVLMETAWHLSYIATT